MEKYQTGKQTIFQLATKYNCSKRTIQRKLDLHKISNTKMSPIGGIILTDATHYGRGSGVMSFKNAVSKENLLKYYIKTETNKFYLQDIQELKSKFCWE